MDNRKLASSAGRQLSVLVFAFAMVFSISLVLILFENVKKDELAARRGNVVPISERVVAGAAAGPGIASYREYAVTSAQMLDSLVERLGAEESILSWEADSAYGALLDMEVPSLYQALHFQMIQLADNLRKEPVDSALVLEQHRALFEQYPWLISSPQ